MEQNGILWAQTVSKVLSLKNSLELSEEFKWIFNASNDLEVLVNILLKFSLNWWNINIELYKISIKGILDVV